MEGDTLVLSITTLVLLLLNSYFVIQNTILIKRNNHQSDTICGYADKLTALRQRSSAIKRMIEYGDELNGLMESEFNTYNHEVTEAQEQCEQVYKLINSDWPDTNYVWRVQSKRMEYQHDR